MKSSHVLNSNRTLEDSLRSRESREELNEAEEQKIAKAVENLTLFLPSVSNANLKKFAYQHRHVKDVNQLTNLALQKFKVD